MQDDPTQLFDLVKEFIHEQKMAPFVGQSIFMDDFKAWVKKKDPEAFDEVIH